MSEVKANLKAAKKASKAARKFYQKKRFYIGLLGAFIIIVSIAGGSDGEKAAPTDEIKSAVADPAVKEPAAPTSEIYAVGDTVVLKDLKVKVNKVSSIPGSQYNKPAAGNEWIAADITLENTSADEIAISSVMLFKIVDQDGRSQDLSLGGTIEADAGQLDGLLAAGRKMSGAYAVEVKKGTTGLELEFLSGIFGTEQIIVKLN